MPGIPEMMLAFAIAVLLLVLFYATGFAIYIVVQGGKATSIIPEQENLVFPRILVGLFLITGTYACIQTSLNTSLLPLPLLAFVLARFWLPSVPNPGTTVKLWRPVKVMLLAALVCTVFFAGQLYLFIPKEAFASLGGDSEFYARVANHLNDTQRENLVIDPLKIVPAVPQPYHYSDIWLLALIQKGTGISPMISVFFILYPLLAAIFSLGLFNYLISSRIRPNLFLLAFAFMFSGFSFLFPGFLLDNSGEFRFALVEFLKLFIPGICLVALMENINSRSWHNCFLLVTLTSISSISLSPSLILSTIISLAAALLLRKLILGKRDYMALLISLASGIFFLLYYTLQSEKIMAEDDPSIRLKTTVNIIGGGVLQLLQLLPFLLFAGLLHYYRQLQQVKYTSTGIWFLAISVGAGLLTWSLTYAFSYEFIQFYYNILAPAVAILVTLLLSIGLISERNFLKFSTVLLAVASVAFTMRPHWDRKVYNRQDVGEATSFYSKYGEGVSANLKGSAAFPNVFSRNTIFQQPLQYLSWPFPGYYSVSLNTADFRNEQLDYPAYESGIIKETPFHIYTSRNPGKDRETQGFEFMQQYRIRYLFVGADTILPVKWQTLVKDSVVLTDKSLIYYIGE